MATAIGTWASNNLFKRVAIAIALLATATAASAQTYDLKSDWSDSTNPNGVWSYNDGAGAISNHVADYLPGVFASTQQAWAYAGSGPGHIVSWFKGASDGMVPFACVDCSNSDWKVGDVISHTWDSASSGGLSSPNSNVTWTSPSAGIASISGAAWLARNIGRSVDWSLAVNGSAISSGSLFDGDAFDRASPLGFASGSGGARVLSGISVLAGDKISLSLMTTSVAGEFTGVNIAVSLAPVPEPETYGMLLAGLALLIPVVSKRRRTRQ